MALGRHVLSMLVTLRDKEPRWQRPLGVRLSSSTQDVLSLQLASGLLHFSRHASEAVSLIAGFTLAHEGAWSVVADGIRVTPAQLTFIHILAGSAIPREARQTGTVVGGTLRVDTLGPLRNVTVMEASCAIVDGALGLNRCACSCI